MQSNDFTPTKPTPDLLKKMAEQAYEIPADDSQEMNRKLFEDMCRRTHDRKQIDIICFNYGKILGNKKTA